CGRAPPTRWLPASFTPLPRWAGLPLCWKFRSLRFRATTFLRTGASAGTEYCDSAQEQAALKVYRIGVIGAGMMGKTHAWCWQSLPFFYADLDFRCVLHGVCTSRRETAEAARETLGFQRAYASAEEMIADSEIDVVDIASPNRYHLAA